jgi:hypothetical protein
MNGCLRFSMPLACTRHIPFLAAIPARSVPPSSPLCQSRCRRRTGGDVTESPDGDIDKLSPHEYRTYELLG